MKLMASWSLNLVFLRRFVSERQVFQQVDQRIFERILRKTFWWNPTLVNTTVGNRLQTHMLKSREKIFKVWRLLCSLLNVILNSRERLFLVVPCWSPKFEVSFFQLKGLLTFTPLIVIHFRCFGEKVFVVWTLAQDNWTSLWKMLWFDSILGSSFKLIRLFKNFVRDMNPLIFVEELMLVWKVIGIWRLFLRWTSFLPPHWKSILFELEKVIFKAHANEQT